MAKQTQRTGTVDLPTAQQVTKPGARVMASPFLPSLPAVALPILGRVGFPGTTRPGGLLTVEDRDVTSPRRQRPINPPNSYTRAVGSLRVGGKWPVHYGSLH